MIKIITVDVGGQWLAIPVQHIIDVVRTPHMTRVPCNEAWVRGVQNLRGRLVTALDLCAWLGMPDLQQTQRMSVIVQHGTEHFSLLANRVGDVFDIRDDDIRPNPRTLATGWAEISLGVVELPDIGFVVVVAIDTLLAAITRQAA